MQLSKKLLLYLGLFVVTYGLLYLVFSFKPTKKASAAFLDTTAIGLVKGLLSKAYVVSQTEFRPDRTVLHVGFANKKTYNQAMIQARRSGQKSLNLNLENTDFFLDYFTLPYIFLLTIILITPLPWKHKILALISGSFLFWLFSVFKIYIATRMHIAEAGIGVYELSDTGKNLFRGLVDIMQIGFSLLITLLIWLVVTFRRNNWKQVLGKLNTALETTEKSK